jgi:15-cis-phytoene synthase
VDDLLITEFVTLAKKYTFERSRIEAFFDAMRMDTHSDRYETYEQLQTYMYGSAEVIGLMMTQLIGYKGEKEQVFWYAKKLGEAMQYTNFLRDVCEDRRDHGRVYMP